MSRHRNWIEMLATAVALALCLVLVSPVSARQECEVEISAEVKTSEENDGRVRHEFDVQLTAGGECSMIAYDLILEVMLPNLQWKSIRLARQVELDGGSATDVVEHLTTSDLELLSHRTLIVSCDCQS